MKTMQITKTSTYPPPNSRLQRRYDVIASQWNAEIYDGTRRDDLIAFLIDSSELVDGMVVLDAMSGTGVISSELKRQFPESQVCRLDFSLEMLKAAKNDTHKVKATVLLMPFSDSSYDRIFLRSALYDLPRHDQLNALKELKRVLKQDGVLILQTYHTTGYTHNILNSIVNFKDLAAGYYENTKDEFSRYFATSDELVGWFSQANFKFTSLGRFEGHIKYTQTREIPRQSYVNLRKYVGTFPMEMLKAISLHVSDDDSLVFRFPGAVYKLF